MQAALPFERPGASPPTPCGGVAGARSKSSHRAAARAGAPPAPRRRLALSRSPGLLVLGAGGEPYSEEERQDRLAHRLLRAVERRHGPGVHRLHVSIVTGSPLVTRDVPLLLGVARRNSVEVVFRVPTPDRRLSAVLEPAGAQPAVRFAAIRALRRAGIPAGLIVPVLPGLTDHEGDLIDLFRRAQSAGALFVDLRVVMLPESRQVRLLRQLRASYPRAAARLEVRMRATPRPDEVVRAELGAQFAELGRRFGVPSRPPREPPPARADPQQRFAFAADA